MRVLTNTALIERNRRLAHISFFVSIGTLAGAFFLSNWLGGNNPQSGTFFNCLVVPSLFFLILFSVRLSNQWVREPVAWKALPDALHGLSPNAVIYNYILPVRHVLIAPQGVFTLYPMFQDRPIKIVDDQWQLLGSGFSSIIAFMRQEHVGKPVENAKLEAAEVQAILDKMFPDNDIEVQPLIVFTSPRAQVVLEGEQTVPVVFASGKLEPALKEYIRGMGKEDALTLTDEQIAQLDEKYIYE
jgi:hypothetical protein